MWNHLATQEPACSLSTASRRRSVDPSTAERHLSHSRAEAGKVAAAAAWTHSARLFFRHLKRRAESCALIVAALSRCVVFEGIQNVGSQSQSR